MAPVEIDPGRRGEARKHRRILLVDLAMSQRQGRPRRQGPIGRARPRIDGDGQGVSYILPALPAMEVGKAVCAHDPDETPIGQRVPQKTHRLPGISKALLGLEAGDTDTRIVDQRPRGPRGGAVNWASGFLPTAYQGVPLRGQGDPILNISSPRGISVERQRRTIDAVRDLNLKRLVETGDPEISTRIAAYEMAYKMQSSAPELIDLSGESEATLNLYGIEKGKPSFARNCLLARRLVERGSRFVQLYHTNWDSHGGPGENLQGDFEKICREVDQAQAALIKDLKSRGMLKDTLVIWGGEFGRTPMGENRDTTGRNHHIDAFTMWFAGAGVKAGAIVGETDELGFNPTENRAHVHDIHATLLHLLGLDHKKLTFRFQGRDFRLTDVHGEIIQPLLA